METLPSGTVTFLFTDIEGSTKLAREHPETWEAAQARHHAILREAIESNNGYVFKIIGDAFCAAFHTASDGLNAAIDAQRGLQTSEVFAKHPRSEAEGAETSEVLIRVRMGLHTGKAEFQEDGEYHGYLTLAKAQRVMSVAYGGQVLLCNVSADLLRNQLQNGISLRDLREHRLKGFSDLERLWQVIAPDLQQNFPPLQSLKETPNNLPVQLTSFIGREKEVAQIKDRLEKNRFVTLTGSGGIGKTRLSIQVASELMESYPNGVWLIELAPITDPALVTQTVCAALSVSPQGNTPALTVLTDYLKQKKLLLVVDNCEHLIDASAQLCEALLHACPNIKIIASSREALGIDGEATYHVSSLGLPDINHLPPIDTLSRYEAVKLFIDRATSAVPNFKATNDNASFLTQICRRLDGIPLAIELAATKIRILSVEQIAKRLDDRFRLLTGGSRTALERHQTLRATIDWSYNLLPPNEQILFRRLSVFVGGWTLEAVESVCGDEPIKGDDVLELLEQLINKSIVIAEETQYEPRYKMLENIRQYANEKLVEAGEEILIHQKHAECFSELAEEIYHGLLAKQNEYKLVKRLNSDLDNFRAALGWLNESSAYEDGIWVTIHLEILWMDQPFFQEGLKWLELWLKNRTSLPMRAIAFALMLMGRLYTRSGDFDKAMQYGAESIDLLREIGDIFALAHALKYFGTTFDENRDYDKAYTYYSEALALYRDLGKKELANEILISIGWLKFEGNASSVDGFAILEECLQTARKFNEPSTLAFCLYALGFCRWNNNELERAESSLKESLRIYYQLENIWFALACLGILGGIASSRDQMEQATKIMGAMTKGIESVGAVPPPFWKRDIYDPIIASIRNQIDDRDFENAWEKGYSMTMNQVITFALEMAK